MNYNDLNEHLSVLTNTDSYDSSAFEWPFPYQQSLLLPNKIIFQGLKLKNIHLNNLKFVLGGLARELDNSELILALHCKIHTSLNITLIDLQYAYSCCTCISASATSGKYIEPALEFYKNRSMLQIMLMKDGLFWLREEPEELQKTQT
ncbi:MAG: hypothetical protein OEY89_04895 [Gammaproteobacteria bacterium]|nr:hypothetical protein [Gammaproteobacteria bacterium]